MKIVQDKINQTFDILNELNIDCWIIFVRESTMSPDPAMPMVVGHDVTWQSFFIYTRNREAIALVGNFDQDNFIRSGCFTEVKTYTEDASTEIQAILDIIKPAKIAVNYSTDNVAADGLSHGMFLLLQKYLSGSPFVERLVSSEPLLSKLRSRKLPEEISRVRTAAELANEVWTKTFADLREGMTEEQVGSIIDYYILNSKNKISFPTIVNAGAKTSPGHSLPTDAKLAGGDLLHVDFGIKYKEYCSDIQRLAYFRKPAEKNVPPELTEAFDLVVDIISATGKMCKPGACGFEIDAEAREMLKENGFEVYQHALGHQLGRDVHDGGALIGPKWERYGNAPMIPLELNNIFTLELEIILPGIGCVGLEEDIIVTENGAEYLCPRQTELVIL